MYIGCSTMVLVELCSFDWLLSYFSAFQDLVVQHIVTLKLLVEDLRSLSVLTKSIVVIVFAEILLGAKAPHIFWQKWQCFYIP